MQIQPVHARSRLIAVLAAFSLIAIAQNAWYWNQLPQRVATHFGTNGQPDAWMDKSPATLLLLGLQLGLPWFLTALGQLIKVMPISLINLPNREYWLAAERRDESVAYLQQFLAAIGITLSLFMMAVNHLTYLANMRQQALNLNAFATLLVLYLIGIGLMIVGLYRRFRLRTS